MTLTAEPVKNCLVISDLLKTFKEQLAQQTGRDQVSSVYTTLPFMLDQVSSVLLQLALGWQQQHSLCCAWLNTAQLRAHTDPALISISRDLAGRIVKSQTKSAAPSCSFSGKQALKGSVMQFQPSPVRATSSLGVTFVKSQNITYTLYAFYNSRHSRNLDRMLQMAQ